jgi:23S rRNA A2030 N6-methylase RlmJ
MLHTKINDIFTPKVLEDLLPLQRSDEFFEALYGDADEGAYNISLSAARKTGKMPGLQSHLWAAAGFLPASFDKYPRPGRKNCNPSWC